MINNFQIAPLTALQKLLSSNQPFSVEKRLDQSKQKSFQKSIQHLSSSQYDLINNQIKNKISTPKNAIDSSLRKSVGKLPNDSGLKSSKDSKYDFLKVLKKTSIINKKTHDLNSLLSQKNNSKRCSELGSFKMKRPPLLQYLGEENEKQNVQSSKSVENQKKNILNKYSSGNNQYDLGFFTSTHQRQQLFGSINEVLKQYMQSKSQQKCKKFNYSEAGTGEGIQVCKSARNTDGFTQTLKVENKEKCISKQKSDYTQASKSNLKDNLQNLFLKSQKVLEKYKMKEALWKQQKTTLKEEIRLLKSLLSQ